ncbi:MAG TPA: lytic murein transglycosylase B [Burkholderiales bacterium]|nr:lytic murein transglycosylase B [Burkholderiales bacterium]
MLPASAQQKLRTEYEGFIDEMAGKHGIERASLRRLFARIKPQPSIIRAMNAPSTSRPWYEFRKNHVNAMHINGGAKFWLKHAATLERAALDFGVPEDIITATIGIETHYGGYTGNFRIIDALATLAFDYPKRAGFFRDELEQFVLMGEETSLDLAGLRGSYAGAMGMPQFMPSSYRKYAVDFDGDGQRNLWSSVPDVIGSVANYYKSHEWQSGEAVVVPASVTNTPDSALTDDITPKMPIGEFRKLGIEPTTPVSDDALAALLPLENENGMQYWFGFKNFYVITRYNRSTNYAMAVYEIAQGIKAQMKGA